MLSILSYIYLGPLYVLLGEVSVQVLCPFLIGLFVFLEWSLCEFFIYFRDQNLVWIFICKYIFPYGGFPFRSTAVFFSHAELFILMNSHLFILSYMSLALGDISVKILLCGICEILLTMFSARIFMASQLIFKSFIHLEFIFVYGISWWLSFIFFMYLSRSSSTSCWRGYFYSILYSCPLCQILVDHRDLGLFLGCIFCCSDLCVCSYASTRLFWLQWPYNTVLYQVSWSLLLCCSFPRLLRIFRVDYGSI